MDSSSTSEEHSKNADMKEPSKKRPKNETAEDSLDKKGLKIRALKWTQICKIFRSKIFWSLSLMLTFVPLLAKGSIHIGLDTFILYLAALLALVASVIKILFCPPFVDYEGYGAFEREGWTVPEAKKVFAKEILNVVEPEWSDDPNESKEERKKREEEVVKGWNKEIGEEIKKGIVKRPTEVSVFFNNIGSADKVYLAKYHLLRESVDEVKLGMRRTITWLFFIIFLAFLIVNGYRACIVLGACSGSLDNKFRIPAIETVDEINMINKNKLNMTPSLNAGDDVVVTHDVGAKSPENTEGEILEPDVRGNIVVKKKDGTIVHIPRERVYVVKRNLNRESGFH